MSYVTLDAEHLLDTGDHLSPGDGFPEPVDSGGEAFSRLIQFQEALFLAEGEYTRRGNQE